MFALNDTIGGYKQQKPELLQARLCSDPGDSMAHRTWQSPTPLVSVCSMPAVSCAYQCLTEKTFIIWFRSVWATWWDDSEGGTVVDKSLINLSNLIRPLHRSI